MLDEKTLPDSLFQTWKPQMAMSPEVTSSSLVECQKNAVEMIQKNMNSFSQISAQFSKNSPFFSSDYTLYERSPKKKKEGSVSQRCGKERKRNSFFSPDDSLTNRSKNMTKCNETVGVIIPRFKATVSGLPADGEYHSIRITGTANVVTNDFNETLRVEINENGPERHTAKVERCEGTIQIQPCHN